MIVWSWIIVFEKRVLLIKRSKNKPINASPNYWSFPWWRWEKSETSEETTIRELKEEVWIDFIIEELLDKHLYFNKWDVEHYFYIWNFSWKIILQEEECDWYWWYSFDETKSLLITDRINDIIYKLYQKWLI